jgi:itaconyl-CoA hydratase
MTLETYERDKFGRFLEEYEVDEVIHHWPGRTITEYENQLFTLLTGNSSSAHLDVVDARTAGHPDMLVNGGYVLALVHGMSVRELSVSPKAVFFLGMDKVRILRPTYPGDTIRASTRVLGTRVSESKPDRGVLTVETWADNQRGERVIEFQRAIMVYRKGHGPGAVAPSFSEVTS